MADEVNGKTIAFLVDQEVCRDGNLVSSRNPGDPAAFTDAMLELFA